MKVRYDLCSVCIDEMPKIINSFPVYVDIGALRRHKEWVNPLAWYCEL